MSIHRFRLAVRLLICSIFIQFGTINGICQNSKIVRGVEIENVFAKFLTDSVIPVANTYNKIVHIKSRPVLFIRELNKETRKTSREYFEFFLPLVLT